MKRRSFETNKRARPVRKIRVVENGYSSSSRLLTCVKLFLVWILIMALDYALEFRIEFFWPVWLLLRSCVDSFRYQGMVFMMLFVGLVCISDAICFFLFPSPWLLFAASNYAWVQLVWHSDRGIGLPFVITWCFFVYVEATIRLQDPPPHLDLSRPFAAHCIGYPVVTLGFGLKSYLEFSIQDRRKQAVRKENAFYFELIEKALPEMPSDVESKQLSQQVDQSQDTKVIQATNEHQTYEQHGRIQGLLSWFLSRRKQEEEISSNSVVANGEAKPVKQNGKKAVSNVTDTAEGKTTSRLKPSHKPGTTPKQPRPLQHQQLQPQAQSKHGKHEQQLPEQQLLERQLPQHVIEQHIKEARHGDSHSQLPPQTQRQTEHDTTGRSNNSGHEKAVSKKNGEDKRPVSATRQSTDRKLSDMDVERQLAELAVSEKQMRTENERLKASNEEAGHKMDELRREVQHNGEELHTLGKRLKGEQEARQTIERELETERNKSSSAEEMKKMKNKQEEAEFRLRHTEMEKQSLERQLAQTNENAKKDKDMMMSALSAMKEKNAHLENSLSAETRIKLDLFSALGDAKRKITVKEEELESKSKVCESLEQRIAELMALLPSSATEEEKDMPMDGRISTRNFHSDDSIY